MCPHWPPCPAADRPDRDAARAISLHPEQGWSLLCNGVIVFDDTGELLPDGRAVPPRPAPIRGPHRHDRYVVSRPPAISPTAPPATLIPA